jgi:hypothetical protein
MPYCSACGYEITEQDRFCKECGEPITGGSTDLETPTDTTHERSGEPARIGPDANGQPAQSKSAFDFALSYPLQNGVGDLLKAGVALFFFFLVVPLLTFLGYIFRLGHAAALGEEKQPPFDDWTTLTKDGFFFALTLLVLYVGGFLLWLGPAMAILELTSSRVVTGMYGLLYFVLFPYLIPAVLTVYVSTGSIPKAFTPARISEFAFTRTYLKAWLIYLGLSFLLSILVSFAAVTFIGLFFALALAGMVIASYWGRVYHRSPATGGDLAT